MRFPSLSPPPHYSSGKKGSAYIWDEDEDGDEDEDEDEEESRKKGKVENRASHLIVHTQHGTAGFRTDW